MRAKFPLDDVADALATLPGVDAVALGGSRAQGTARDDSDWDFAVYYRDTFDPDELRHLAQSSGWDGEATEIGGWGGGVFNGGAWFTIADSKVDVHYRDLTVINAELARAERGEFHIEPLMFHIAGIPSYLVLAELAMNRVLRGDLPTASFPDALRESASAEWAGRARMNLDYAEHGHAARGRLAQCAALMVVAASECAHSVLASRGEWVTNEKTLLDRAGLSVVETVIAGLTPDVESLVTGVQELRRWMKDRTE